ncbi:hypothetical protein P4V41_20540 [Fictibacillus nanhaiensis]|uniref:hypothetical protein n=1 Tax=Fictibacillus nanhaiensis TaxID=742169 RepID=UPI002E23A64E|nr:hypothetical protein [Fictibacillus nanhaiensis]
MNRAAPHLIVTFIGLSVVFLGISYSDLKISNVYVSCATLAALFFTITDLFNLIDEYEIDKDKVTSRFYKFIIDNRHNLSIFSLFFAIFSIIFLPYVDFMEKYLLGYNNQITLVSLGLVILIISFRALSYEARREKEISDTINEVKDLSLKHQKDLEELQKQCAVLIEENLKYQRKNSD